MTDKLYEHLSGQVNRTAWDSLVPHVNKGICILVGPNLDLVDVGFRTAKDDLLQMKVWLEEGDLVKLDMNRWNDLFTSGITDYDFLIIQPYVFVQVPVN